MKTNTFKKAIIGFMIAVLSVQLFSVLAFAGEFSAKEESNKMDSGRSDSIHIELLRGMTAESDSVDPYSEKNRDNLALLESEWAEVSPAFNEKDEDNLLPEDSAAAVSEEAEPASDGDETALSASADNDCPNLDELRRLYDREDGLVVFEDTWPLLKEREAQADVSLNEVGVYPSAVGSVNYISGIKINHEVRWTGMDAWWAKRNGLITFDENWSRFYTKKISDLKRGDIIEWSDDANKGIYTNHIAVITEVADDCSYFVTADGNAGGKTGVKFITHYNLYKSGSSSGKVNIWRNAKTAEEIANSVSIFTRKIIKTKDTSLIDYFWGTLGINWCYCFVVEALLQVNVDGTYYLKPELNSCKSLEDGIKVSWNPSPGAEEYVVYYKENPADSWIKLAASEETSWLFTEAEPGKAYAFTVLAKGEFGKSKKDKNGKPGVWLDGTTVTAKKANQAVKLSWKAVDKAEGYAVYRRITGGKWILSGTVAGTSYKDTTYQAGFSNEFLVRPYVLFNGQRAYGYMDTAIQCSSVNIPAMPVIKSVASGKKREVITWKQVSGAKAYYIYRKSQGKKWTKIGSTTATVFNDKKVKTDIKYKYSVSAVNAENVESDHNVNPVAGYYVPVCKIKKITKAWGGVFLKWNKVSTATKYRIYRRTPGGKWKRIATVSKRYNSCMDYKGKKGVKYEYLIRADKVKGGVSYLSLKDETLAKKCRFPKK